LLHRGHHTLLEEKLKIYVGNMSYSTTEDGLRTKFEEFGAVEEVAVITDRETGRPRGFGFVTMTSSDEGNAAIEAINGFELDDRTLKVNEARPRGDGPSRPRW
jgi:cold-inducible RNA-binding protein